MKNEFQSRSKKQSQKVTISWKSKAISHPPLMFKKNNVIQATSDKYLGIILGTRLSFEKHLETMLCKINKTIGLICKLQNLLSKTAPITLHKAFVCTHLDYDDIVYDQALIEKKKKSLQSMASPETSFSSIQCLFRY